MERLAEREITLKNGTPVVIRPMQEGDLERSCAFFRELPEKDRAYLRRDVTCREIVAERIRAIESGRFERVVALVEDRIVADAALELEGHGWDEHVAELRLIVARPYRRKGLGRRLARELFAVAARGKVEEVVVKMMRPQIAARSIFRKLGFHEVTVLPDWVKDVSGHKQDLIVMRCNLEGLWRRLEDFIETADWQRMR